MKQIDTIRAALERGLEVLPTYAKTYAQLAEALAALAELEKAVSPQFVAGEVTDAVARKVFNAWIDARWRLNEGQDAKYGHAMINVVRSELGPALGLVEIREPTPEECERIDSMYASLDRTSHGRAMFDACRAVMWPKEGL